MTDNLVLLSAYVNSATNMAESIREDAKRDGKVSIRTIECFNQFAFAAQAMQLVIDKLEQTKVQLN